MERIVGHLDEEGLAGLLTFLHECDRVLVHPEDVDRIRLDMRGGTLIAHIAVAFVIPVEFRASASDMPLSVMSGRISGGLQQFPDGRLLCLDVLPDPRLE